MFKMYIFFFIIIKLVFLPLTGFAGEASFESASRCKECHKDIYQNWKKSLHARSYINPIFTAAYRKAYFETAGKAKEYCLNCHAPTVKSTKDYEMKLPVSIEGVTCDFCHTISEIRMNSGEIEYINIPGKVKRSVLKSSESSYHDMQYSKDFSSSKLCAGCHDFKNRFGVHVGVTYSEWQTSDAAKTGNQCQDCHMPKIKGKIVDQGKEGIIHDHSLSHNVDAMKNVIELEKISFVKESNILTAKIQIKNAGAGHSIPTGTPARSLVLEVRSLDRKGKVIEEKKKIFRKIVVDGKGYEIYGDGDVFLYGETVKSDNRLKPDEKRIETFLFSEQIQEIDHIEADVYFFYQPVVMEQVDMKIPLYLDEWKIP